MKEYKQGYYDALKEMDVHITTQIKRNGGGKDAIQVLNIFNSTLFQLHDKLSEAHEDIKALEEENKSDHSVKVYTNAENEEVEEFINNLFNNIFTSKGDK